MAEERQFTMDPGVLISLITRQAGTVEKAILEMAQNAVDAHSKGLKLTITPTQITAEDDGEGMDINDILTYFERFGNSSKKGQEEMLGEFGIGRGQIFGQGKTIWETQNHRMVVDIKNKGVKYELSELPARIRGTKISLHLYNKLNTFFVQEKLKRWLRYVPLSVRVNGEEYSQVGPTEGRKFETPEATIYINTEDQGLRLYNRGIYVMTDRAYSVAAIVITKKNLKVNLARNDVLDECEIWQKIQADLKHFIIEVLADPGLYQTQDTKRQVVRLIAECDEAKERLGHIAAFKTGNDQWASYDDIRSGGMVSFCSAKDGRLADAYMQQNGKGTILVDRPEYKNIFQAAEGVLVGNFNTLTKSIVISIHEYQPSTDQEKEYASLVADLMNACGFRRRLRFAERRDAIGWTDGSSYVFLNKNLLRLPRKAFVLKAWEVLVHEMSHTQDTERTDLHGEDFYQRYHELVEANVEQLERFL